VLNLPDFNRLKVFYYAYKTQSLVQAARELFVTPSALSQQIKLLEGEVNSCLFTRAYRSIKPTPSADELFKIVGPFVADLIGSVATLEQMSKEPFGRIRVAAPPEFGTNRIIPMIGRFREKYPNVTFQLHLGLPAEAVSFLIEKKTDLAFIDHGKYYEKLNPINVSPLVEEEQVLVGSKKYFSELIKNNFSFETLTKAQFVSFSEENFELKLWFKYQFNRVPARLNIALTVPAVRTLIGALRAGLGIGLMPKYLVQREITAGQFIAVPPRKKFINPIMIAQVPGRPLTQTEKAFIEFIKAEGAGKLRL
jgi:DNA-binding transcriptional LysR family regulator